MAIPLHEWEAMHRWDKAWCKYVIILDDHYEWQAHEDAERERKQEQDRQKAYPKVAR